MPKKFTSVSQKIGKLGEDIACKYLGGKGYFIIECNYTAQCGELDIVAKKGSVLYFIEVKSSMSDGSNPLPRVLPMENMNKKKVERLRKIVIHYLTAKKIHWEWEFHVIIVDINPKTRVARVNMMENVII